VSDGFFCEGGTYRSTVVPGGSTRRQWPSDPAAPEASARGLRDLGYDVPFALMTVTNVTNRS